MAAARKDLVGVLSGITRVIGAGQAAIYSNLQYCTSNSATLRLLCRSLPEEKGLNSFAIDSEWTTHDLPAESRQNSVSKSPSTASSANSTFVRSFHTFPSNSAKTKPSKDEVHCSRACISNVVA